MIATARQPSALSDLAEHERVLLAELDVTRPEQVRAAVQAGLARFGRIDALVNNAGFSIIGAVEETSEAELRATLELMFFGAVNVTKEVVPYLRERREGAIVQITSMGGLTTAPGFGAYCAAKHALEGLSECLAQELKPFGVRVLLVEPGAFRTSLFGAAFRRLPESPAYAPTVGAVRAWVESAAGSQPGDPAKAARAIADTLALPFTDAPLRLPLGGDAVDGIRAKLAAVAADVARVEAVARATSFDPR